SPMQAQTDKTKRQLFALLLLLILVIAGGIRTFKLNWDEGTHLHPDERYLTMVASALEIPSSLGEYWDTANSTLNPENRGYQGYVYGTMPLFAARVVGGWLDRACGETPAPAATLSRWLLMGTGDPCGVGTYTGYNGIHLVGRLLSTSADLLTLLALALLARLLYGDRVALLSAALYACAVLPIQHAHFFVVDSFATVFVIWTLYLAVYAVESGKRWPLLLAGLTTGLALASKVSVWPIAGIVGLAGLLARSVARSGDRPQLETKAEKHYTFTLSLPVALTLALSGILAFIAFRAGQPYAFSGPGFFDFKLNPSWLDTMRYIRQLMSGAIDTPPGHQWANRAPIWFPWRNIVFWGLGLPLGLTAWIGWAVLGWKTIRRCSWVPLLPWLWITIFFLYQSTQWVKSMRYFLSIYPVLVLCAAWILVKAAEWAARREQKTLPHRCFCWLLKALPWLVLTGAALWTLAFLQVYAQPFTRVAASRWMFDHIPTAATVHTQEGLPIQVPLHPHTVLVAGGVPSTTPFTLQMTGELTQITLNKVQRSGSAGPRRLLMALAADPDALLVLAQSEVEITLEGDDPLVATASFAPLAVAAGERLYLQVTLLEGEPLLLDTSVIGNEHWDDNLPQRIDGKDPFGNWYRGLSSSHNSLMNLYDNDTLEKRAQLLAWLDEVDTIALSSNRLYGSIPRLPQRFPLTVAYYRALFDGNLGFELAAKFVSFPALGTCQFPDQEAPFDIPT
ncbi:MAG: glycosyltransferase family 39 protein, partial [Chloroflexota bacterium]|nr:glycosyltransferase family 39 protein [Chloroflexota bacterium]